MRTVLSITIVVLGLVAGLISATQDDWGTRVTMMAVGGFLVAPIAAAVLFGRRRPRGSIGSVVETVSPLAGDGVSAEDLTANYWRDKGHPPFTKPAEGHPDRHQFDPDRLG